jgi:SAM-dependent MidA family methyltransferase
MEEENRGKKEGLKRFILSQIEEKGPVPFSQFMEWCLYHPDYGYYQSGRALIGKDGDYYTSPSVHPLFGHLIAKQLYQMAKILGSDTFDVVEIGGGKGYLCEDILDWAKKNRADFYNGLKYCLVDTSAFFLKEQKERLSDHEKEGKVHWVDSEDFISGKIQIEGCFLANELVDALPIHRVVLDQGSLKEIYVTQDNGRFEERWAPLSDQKISAYFRSMQITLQEGQKAEVNLEALRWLERVSRCLTRGFVLVIDYGYLAEELYAPYRQEGTLLCYYGHRTSENPYERLGEQDITSHVNFTSLIQKGEEEGLELTGLVPQYHFLMALGFLEEMAALEKGMSELEGLKLRLSLKHLIEPERGMGEVFKVLVQHKGIEKLQLDGLRDFRLIP